MPRDPTQTPVCSPEKLECIKEASDIVDRTAFDVDHVTETNCKCLPACSTIEFPFEISTGKMTKANLMHTDKESVGEMTARLSEKAPPSEKNITLASSGWDLANIVSIMRHLLVF